MRIGTLVLIFLIVGSVFIVMINNIDVSEKDDQKRFLGLLFDWIKQVGKNTVNLVGHVIGDYDWLPEKTNSTNSTEKVIIMD